MFLLTETLECEAQNKLDPMKREFESEIEALKKNELNKEEELKAKSEHVEKLVKQNEELAAANTSIECELRAMREKIELMETQKMECGMEEEDRKRNQAERASFSIQTSFQNHVVDMASQTESAKKVSVGLNV